MTSPTVLYTHLLKRLVLDRQTTEDLGRVGRVWIDFSIHKIVGLECKPTGPLGKFQRRGLAWSQLLAVGDDSLLVDGQSLDSGFQRPETCEILDRQEVWTDAGNRAGLISDCEIATDTGAIQRYLYRSSGWRGRLDGTYALPPTAIVSGGSKRLVVRETALATPEVYEPGLVQRLSLIHI